MLDYKSILGFVSIGLAVIAYGIYFWQIVSGEIKPHAFTWLVWSITTAIIFFGQTVKHAGPGAWATGAISLACFIIFILSLFKGQRDFLFFDWIFLAAALISLVFWGLTKDPTIALILLIITDAAATVPTIFKIYHKPFEESLTLFSVNAVRSVISVFAFQIYTFAAVLYPLKLILFNVLIILVIVIRRWQLRVA